jgi:hypothetical protein
MDGPEDLERMMMEEERLRNAVIDGWLIEDDGADKTPNAKLTPAESSRARDPKTGMTFGEAFKANKEGSTFSWNGKQYKRETKKPAKTSKPSAAAPAPAKPVDTRVSRGGGKWYPGNKGNIHPRGMAAGGVASASKRADGCAQRGKTRGRVR